MLPRVRIPEDLVRRYRGSGARLAWLDALPDTIDALLDRWGLQPDLVAYGGPWSGSAAIVVPVRTATGQEAALKISYPFDEALLEPLALGLWNGHGAVRMLRSSREYCAMLRSASTATIASFMSPCRRPSRSGDRW